LDNVKARTKLWQHRTGRPSSRHTGLGDASGLRLTDSAERDYFTLRKRIATVTKQVGYLQEYIKEQCLK
ncbi:TPA: lysis protein, partial [Klebsiella pneumoniae]|nr:lysis protein [Klebsiella pneumoniae]